MADSASTNQSELTRHVRTHLRDTQQRGKHTHRFQTRSVSSREPRRPVRIGGPESVRAELTAAATLPQEHDLCGSVRCDAPGRGSRDAERRQHPRAERQSQAAERCQSDQYSRTTVGTLLIVHGYRSRSALGMKYAIRQSYSLAWYASGTGKCQDFATRH